jgi:hypothetical protein
MRRAATIVGLLLPLAAGARAGDWPMFRGPDGNGISAEKGLPLKWGPDRNVKWKVPLPAPGNSSPVVSGGRVFVTCPSDGGKNRNLFCFDRHSGRQLWVRTVEGSDKEPSHATNPYCSPSPAADGERVVVWYGAAGLHCYDYAGTKLWSRDLGTFEHIWGYGSSPVLYKGAVLLSCGPGRRQFVTALDRRTGKTLWETEEPAAGPADRPREQRWVGSWSTPVLVRPAGRVPASQAGGLRTGMFAGLRPAGQARGGLGGPGWPWDRRPSGLSGRGVYPPAGSGKRPTERSCFAASRRRARPRVCATAVSAVLAPHG